MAKVKPKKKPAAAKKKSVVASKKVVNKSADSKESVELALEGRKKLSLQKRNGDTIVYVRMKPPMWERFEAAYAAHCLDNLLNPKSYGMSTFVREQAFANLKANGAI